jgi:LysM repeat protein
MATGEHAVVRSHHAHQRRRASQSVRRAGVLGVTVLLLVPVAMALRAEAAAPRRVAPLSTTPVSAVGSLVVQPDALAAADASAKVAIEALTPIVPEPTDPPATQAIRAAQAAPRAAAAVKATATTVKAAKPVAKKAPAACTKYTIVAGDAWITIAHRASVTLGALLKVNQARTTSALTPGHTVCLPAGASIATPPAKATTNATKATTTTAKAATAGTTHTTSPPATNPELVPPANTYTRDEIIQIIRDVWPDDLEDHAIAIADRESHLNPSARNFCCYGLFQVYYSVHRAWLGTIGVVSPAQLWDPRVNALVAYQMYMRSGFAPWGG